MTIATVAVDPSPQQPLLSSLPLLDPSPSSSLSPLFSIMTLPNELIDHIFEYVYTSLCHHAAQRELDFPIGSKFVFSNFSLVSKNWHSLSLPFLVRHFDGQNVEAFTEFVEKYQLYKSIKSIYLNPEIKGWPDPGIYENDFRACEMPEYECGEAAMSDHQEDVRREVRRWSRLLERAVPTLSTLEIGSRRRNKLERGPWYGEWHHRSGDDEEDGYGPWETAPALDLDEFLKIVPLSRQVHSLRLNLPDEVGSAYDDGPVDAQFASTISSRFPNLRQYTLHSHSKIALTKRATLVQFPPLQSLRILNGVSDSLGISHNLRPIYLLPSAATLRSLKLQIVSPDWKNFTIPDLFGNLRFPLLEELHLNSFDFSCAQSDFFDRFPRIKSATIPFIPIQTNLLDLPVLPASLQQLTLSCRRNSSLVHLAQYLRRENLSHLTRLVLQSFTHYVARAPESLLPLFETSENPTTELAEIIRICSLDHVEVCHSMALPDEGGVDVDTSAEELSEDENWDFEGEDGDEFRKLWSTEKKRSHDIDEGFKKFRYWIKNDEAESKAKDLIEPCLR
ncbi:hypothetical protein JCM3765_007734 [Sporobolomyces pararoseus]